MNNLDVKFFPAQEVKNGHLGNGFIRSGVCSVRFSAWVNPKFSQGFSLRLPTRKVGNEYKDEVTFINREAQDAVYGIIAPQVAPLLGQGAPAQAANTGFQQQAPNEITQMQQPAPGTGAPNPPF